MSTASQIIQFKGLKPLSEFQLNEIISLIKETYDIQLPITKNNYFDSLKINEDYILGVDTLLLGKGTGKLNKIYFGNFHAVVKTSELVIKNANGTILELLDTETNTTTVNLENVLFHYAELTRLGVEDINTGFFTYQDTSLHFTGYEFLINS